MPPVFLDEYVLKSKNTGLTYWVFKSGNHAIRMLDFTGADDWDGIYIAFKKLHESELNGTA